MMPKDPLKGTLNYCHTEKVKMTGWCCWLDSTHTKVWPVVVVVAGQRAGMEDTQNMVDEETE